MLRSLVGSEMCIRDRIEKLLVYDPKRRLTATQALQHPYFTATGGGLGDPTFDQPLSTVGIPRPTQTNSAPASQQQYGTTSSTSPSLNGTFNKPATADRPVIDPIAISKPPGGGSVNYQTYPTGGGGGTDSNNSTMQGGAVPAYKRYSQDMTKLPGVTGGSGTTTANVPAYRAYASSNTQKQPSHARPPTKIVPSHAYASSGGGGLPPTSTTASNNPAMARKSPAPVSDDLDDLLDEFTSDVAGTKKNTNSNSKPYVSSSSTAATHSGLNLNLGAIGGASPTGGGNNNNSSSANNGVSPLAKLLNSARYRNGGNTTTTTSSGSTAQQQQSSSVLKPPSSFVSSSNTTTANTTAQQQKPRSKPKVNNSFDIDEELAWLDGK
eukprot:TRINITY_DN13802_c0_g2_i1.p1 TRINITY_DN13802_c0_g2~~TRINITY_DN13802_c0_g2_i1.p1  ORF type:complete len:410 (+),score=132.59 TRINITY_DN13802_c0_g2_i1:92-1231(+)